MIGRPLIRLDSVTSTQDVAFRLAERGATEGTTVRARYQSGGRGRAGRSWDVAPGEALLCSILLRPAIALPRLAPLSILIGDAIASVLQDLFDLQPYVKWPNDVLLNGRKVAGVLIQTRQSAGQTIAVVGVGINLTSDSDRLPPAATSIRAETGAAVDGEEIFRAVLDGIGQRYRDLHRDAIEPYLAHVNDVLWLHGRQVTVEDAGRTIIGRLDRVDTDGSLILQTDDGLRRIVSGEMTRGPRPQVR